MPTPASFDVTMWQPHMMLPVAADLRSMAKTVLEQAAPAYSSVVGLNRKDDWVGKSRLAADDRADLVRKWLTNVSDNLSDVATSIEKGCENIANQKEHLSRLQGDASAAGYVLRDPMDPAWPLELREGRDEEPGDADAMRSWSQRLVAQANDTFAAVQDMANSLSAELGQVASLTPAQLALNGTMGRRDAAMAKDGWSPEELAAVSRHLQDAQLTPAQIEALLNGEVADVPPGLVSYLRNLYGDLSTKDALALRYGLDGLGDGSGRAFANGINTLSNEHVEGGGTAGGFGELPGWMQDVMKERVDPAHEDEDTYNNFARSVALGQLLHGATTPPGARAGTELSLKTSNLAEAARLNPKNAHLLMSEQFTMRSEWAEENGLRDPHHAYGDSSKRYQWTMESLLNTGLLNHESATSILTGQGAGIPDGYDRTKTLELLAGHDWRDHGKLVGNLTNWIDDYASDQNNTYKSELSARAFRGLFDASTGADDFNKLMNIGGDDKPAIGDVNPLFAKALEEATRPYLNVLGGGNPHNYGFDPEVARHLVGLGDPQQGEIAKDLDMQDRVRRLFALISSGDTNPDGVTGLTAREQLIQDVGYRQSVNAGMVPAALAEGAGFDADLAARNGWLQSLLRDGVMAGDIDHWHDEHPGDKKMDPATFNSLKSNVSTVVKEGIKLLPIPGSSHIATGAGMIIDWAHPPTSVPPHDGVAPTRVQVDDTLLEQHWATWAATNPQPLPDDPLRDVLFDAEGRLKPLAVIVAENNQDENGGPTVGEDTLSKAVADRLRAQEMDLGSYDATYNRYAGDDDNALSAEDYENELLGK